MPTRSSGGERPGGHDPNNAPESGDRSGRRKEDDAAATRDRGPAPAGEERLHPHARMALATWPQIDPTVESIVNHVGDANKILMGQMRENLAHVGLMLEEFKVLMELRSGPRTHGDLSRRLEVSTGAMTNRLDKLEREGLVSRSRDPNDRRGVVLSLTEAGRGRLDAYIDRGANRERRLMEGLTQTDKRRLNDLLAKLLDSLRAE
jgi:DNA-binding MarR family transcriptional regulator